MNIIAPNYVNDMKWHNHNADNFLLIHKKRTLLKHMLCDLLPFNCHTSTLKFDLKIFVSLKVFEILRYYRTSILQAYKPACSGFFVLEMNIHSILFKGALSHFSASDSLFPSWHKCPLRTFNNFSLEKWAEICTEKRPLFCSVLLKNIKGLCCKQNMIL